MPDLESKKRWERDNVIVAHIKVNRNQDPELFELLQQSENKSGTIRSLLQKAMDTSKPSK